MRYENAQKEMWRKGDYSIPTKVETRQSVLDVYCNVFNRQSVPENQSYWTVGGRHYNNDGSLRKNTEYDHLIKKKFIQPDQFVSVESDKKIHRRNSLIQGPTWIHNDFNVAITNAIADNSFNAAVLNYDIPRVPTTEEVVNYIVSILYEITKAIERKEIGDILVSIDLILRERKKTKVLDSKDVLECLFNTSRFGKYVYSSGLWNFFPFYYEIPGLKSHSVPMGYFHMWHSSREPGKK